MDAAVSASDALLRVIAGYPGRPSAWANCRPWRFGFSPADNAAQSEHPRSTSEQLKLTILAWWVVLAGVLTRMGQRPSRENNRFPTRASCFFATSLTGWGSGSVHRRGARAHRMRTGGSIAPAEA